MELYTLGRCFTCIFIYLVSESSGDVAISVDDTVSSFFFFFFLKNLIVYMYQGRIQDFKLGGAYLKNGAERREARKLLGYFV